MKRTVLVVVFGLMVVLSMAGCKAHKGGGSDLAEGSPAEQVSALLDSGKVDEASDVVARQEAFFAGTCREPDVKMVLERLAGALDYKYSPVALEVRDAAQTMDWPVTESAWLGLKNDIEEMQAKVDSLKEVKAFKYPQYRPAAYDQGMNAFNDLEGKIRAGAAEAFAVYPLGTGRDFFAEYPVRLAPQSFMEENGHVWEKAMSGFTASQSDVFLATYGQYLPPSARTAMAVKYFNALCPKGKNASLKDILSAYEKCSAAGMALDTIPGVKIAFLQVTSPDLIKEKAIDFPISVKVDIPFDASKASMRQAFSHSAVKKADILILMNVALSKAKRVVDRNEKIESMYVASYRKEENPEYDIIRAELEAASDEHHAAKAAKTTSWATDLIVHWVEESEKDDKIEQTGKRLEELKQKMRTTPKYLSVPDYQPYPVSKAHMDIYKYATVNYYIVDKRNKVIFRDTFDISQKSFFTVCYDLQDSDPNKEKFLQTAVIEEDVMRHEMEPVAVNLSDLLEQYMSRPSAWKKYASMAAVHRAIVKDRSTAQARLKNDTFEYDKFHDKRFDSVVVVRNLGSGLGSGFYVTDDMVLTNYHVVEENNYVKLKLFNERETMGRVIARDAHLDLALIQADLKMKPVRFYGKRTIPLGSTVELIGHPNGLEYTITRGALSSVREMPPINFGRSSDWLLYIQTDAAINGGNSGGPMFFGNYVVGVNDFKILKAGPNEVAQGLNFAIHYSEVFKFLDQNGITVRKGSK